MNVARSGNPYLLGRSANPSASPFFSRAFTGLRRPKRRIVGTEFAGVVDAVSPGVKEFAPGDEVFGFRGGANAEFVCVPEHGAIAHKPASIGFEEAGAATNGACIARACLKKVDLREGKPPRHPLDRRYEGDPPISVYSKGDILHVKELIEAGRYRTIIDRTVPLDDVVEATRYVETGEKTGNVVLTVGGLA